MFLTQKNLVRFFFFFWLEIAITKTVGPVTGHKSLVFFVFFVLWRVTTTHLSMLGIDSTNLGEVRVDFIGPKKFVIQEP